MIMVFFFGGRSVRVLSYVFFLLFKAFVFFLRWLWGDFEIDLLCAKPSN